MSEWENSESGSLYGHVVTYRNKGDGDEFPFSMALDTFDGVDHYSIYSPGDAENPIVSANTIADAEMDLEKYIEAAMEALSEIQNLKHNGRFAK